MDALHEIAALAATATGAAEIEICSRAGAVSRTLLRRGSVPPDVPVHRREAITKLPIGSELVVVGSFVARPPEGVQAALAHAASGAVGVLGMSVMIEPGRHENSPFALFDSAPMPMWIYDVESLRFLDVNAYAVGRYGFSREEFLAMTIADIRPPDDVPSLEEHARSSRPGFVVWKHFRHRWKNGQLRDVEIVSYDIDYHGRAARLVIVDDVTEQRRAEQTKELLIAAVENLEELVILFQRPRRGRRLPRITFVNAAFERMFGWDRGYLLTGDGVREIVSGLNEVVSRSLVDLMFEQRPSHAEFDVRDSEGRVLTLEFAVEPVRLFDTADTSHWVAIARNVSERRALAERSIQAQRLEAMGMLAGGIAHDFNNLVVAISGFSQLALKQLPADSRAADDIRQVFAAAGRAAALAQQLLAFSRRQEMSPQRVDLCALVGSLEPMLRRLVGGDIRLQVHCAHQGIEVLADRSQLEQVVLNLVVNARDAQPNGGTIDIRLEVVAQESLGDRFPELSSRGGEQPWVRLTVTDAGPGIDAAVAARAFEPFYTTRDTGTGLGLSTVHGIVTQSGGYVALTRAPAGGTCAEVLLPSPEDADVQNEAARARPEAPPSRNAVLVLGDDAHARRATRLILRDLGLRVFVAGTMAEAAKCLTSESAVGVAVIDLQSTEQARQSVSGLRTLRPELAVVIVGDAAPDGDQVVAVQRPVTADALHDAVQRVTRS